jgi:predicted GNAT family acetyltransferase
MALAVVDNPARSRFELLDDGHLRGFTEYRELGDGVVELPHTVITEPERGGGLGSTLVRGALDALRARGVRIVPTCPFVVGYVERHPEYADLVRG